MARTLTIGGQTYEVAPSKTKQRDAQPLESLQYWFGAKQLLLERQAYDQAQHDALEERLKPLEAWVDDQGNRDHPRYHEAEGKHRELENWRLTYSKSWLGMIAFRLDEIDGWAREIAARLSDDGREKCRLIGWPKEICDGTPF